MCARVGGLLALVAVVTAGRAWADATTERVSVGPGGVQANDDSYSGGPPALSTGGRFAAFPSAASNLVEGDTNGVYDVFVRDRKRGRTERVSVGQRGVQGD